MLIRYSKLSYYYLYHLWHLSEQLAIISLFYDNVPLFVKQKMIRALKKDEISTVSKNKKFEIEPGNLDTLLSKDMSDFISNKLQSDGC